MTDFTHHTPRLLSDADAAADLAGVARPLSSEQPVEAILALVREYVVAFVDGIAEDKPSSDPVRIEAYARLKIATYALVSERDELASRVRELEGALCQISDMTFDPWTNGAIAKQIADAALNASKEQP